jgi:hypothetical protein
MKGVGTIEVNKEEIKEGSIFEHAAVAVAHCITKHRLFREVGESETGEL